MTKAKVPTTAHTFSIGDWQVSPGTCTLRRITQTDPLSQTGNSDAASAADENKITPRSMDVLKHLAEHPGQVVSTAELLEQIWRSPIASDHAVHKAIAELRGALGDKANRPEYIRTIPKRGYTLIAEVRTPAEEAENGNEAARRPTSAGGATGENTARARPKWLTWSSAAVVALLIALGGRAALDSAGFQEQADAGQNAPVTLAVLPFTMQDFNNENLILGEGIREALIHGLSKLSHLQVISASRESEDPDISVRNEADHRLHGSVFSSNGRLRVIVQLTRTEDGVQQYSDQFDLMLDDIFSIQDEIASNVVSALRVHLDEQERSQMLDWGTTNALAYERFLRGEFYYNQFSPRDFRKAIDYYLAAAELDPDFLNAYHGAATAANNLAVYSSMGTIAEMYDLVLEMHREVSRINPESEIIDSINDIKLRMHGSNHVQQERQLRAHILSDNPPDFALAHYALLLIGARMYDEAARYLELATESSPFEISPDEVWSYRHSVKTPAQLINARKLQLQQRPYHIGFLGTIATNLAFLGDFRQANVYLRQQESVDPEGIIHAHSRNIINFLGGRLQPGTDALEKALRDDPDHHYNNGALSFMLGDVGQGIHYWSQLQPVQLRRLFNRAHVVEKYFPAQVVESPRYHALLEQLGNGRDWQRTLMEGVMAMSGVTGVDLHPASRAAYDNNHFMIHNNLWSEQDWQEFELHKQQRAGYQAGRETIGANQSGSRTGPGA